MTRQTVIIVAALTCLVGLIAGGAAGFAIGQSNVKSTPTYKDVVAQRDAANTQLVTANADLAAAKAATVEAERGIPAREIAVKKAEADLKEQKTAADKRDADLTAREKKVGIIETEISNNTVAGDGTYEVGTDMKPGRYKTDGATGCYYAVLNSTDSSDIADNGNPDGMAYATVRQGQYFETARCADWVLQP